MIFDTLETKKQQPFPNSSQRPHTEDRRKNTQINQEKGIKTYKKASRTSFGTNSNPETKYPRPLRFSPSATRLPTYHHLLGDFLVLLGLHDTRGIGHRA